MIYYYYTRYHANGNRVQIVIFENIKELALSFRECGMIKIDNFEEYKKVTNWNVWYKNL